MNGALKQRQSHEPPTLAGCDVLPALAARRPHRNGPVEAAHGSRPRPGRGTGQERNTRRQAAGRFTTLNTFADATLCDLDRAQIAVWLLLFRDTKPEGLARTSQADLARRAGVTTRTVERAIHKLERAGLLTVVSRGGLSRGPSTYRVHPIEKPK